MKKNPLNLNGKKPLVNSAYEEIYKKIICLNYKPGQPLQEKTLTAQLNIGRTPIREALFRLSNEHLVEFKPKAGFIVKPITFQSVKSMFKALKLFELGAAQFLINEDLGEYLSRMVQANKEVDKALIKRDVYALVMANNEYHMSFAQCSQNEFLIRAIHEVRCEANRMAYLFFGRNFETKITREDYCQSIVRNHNELIEAIERRDLKCMEKIITEHINNFQKRIVNYLIA